MNQNRLSAILTGQYINLDKDVKRRENMEEQISRFQLPYTRHRAIPSNEIKDHEKYERINYISAGLNHITVLKNSFNSNKHLHILEDDVVISDKIDDYIPKILSGIGDLDWDIIYTDIVFGVKIDLLSLDDTFRNFLAKGKIRLWKLKDANFAGTSSYIVNKNSLEKVYELTKNIYEYGTIAHDLVLKRNILEGKINAYVTVPFLTKPSEESRSGSLESRNMTWEIASELIREMFFVDFKGDLSSHKEAIDFIKKIKTDKRRELLLGIIRYSKSVEYQRI